MDAKKKERLAAAGWRVGSTAEFLDLTAEESALIEFKISLGHLVRRTRVRYRLSQQELAHRLSSNQSRVAKVEAGDAGCVSGPNVQSCTSSGSEAR